MLALRPGGCDQEEEECGEEEEDDDVATYGLVSGAYKSKSVPRVANQLDSSAQSGEDTQLEEEEATSKVSVAGTDGNELAERLGSGLEKGTGGRGDKEGLSRVVKMKKVELILILTLMAAIVYSVGAARVSKMIYFVQHQLPVYSASSQRFRLATRLSGPGNSNNNNRSSAPDLTRAGTNSEQVLVQGQLFEAPWLSRSEPKWMDACNKRSSHQETLINVIIGPQLRHSSQAIEEERRKRAKLIKKFEGVKPEAAGAQAAQDVQSEERLPAAATSARADDEHVKERPKRSPPAPPHAPPFSGPEKSILLKRPESSSLSSSSPSRLTATYETALAWQRSRANRNRYFHSSVANQAQHEPSGGASAHKPAHVSPGSYPTANITGKPGEPLQVVDEQALYKLLEAISASEIRLAWYINRALNTASSLKRALGEARLRLAARGEEEERLAGEKAGNLISPDQVNSINEQRKWLPKLTDLIRENQHSSAGENHHHHYEEEEPHHVLANVSHYLQYFSVALEQMVFEQVDKDERLWRSYCHLERLNLRILCDLESLVRLLIKEQADGDTLVWFAEQLKGRPIDTLVAGGRDFLSLSRALERRNKYTFSTIYSPYLRENNYLSSNNSNRAPLVYVSRQVMPLSLRQVTLSAGERNMRDRSILEDFDTLLEFYESVLTHIYAPYKRKTGNSAAINGLQAPANTNPKWRELTRGSHVVP